MGIARLFRTWALLPLLGIASQAQSGVYGGGIGLSEGPAGTVGPEELLDGRFGCLSLMGFRAKNGTRLGGEAYGCTGGWDHLVAGGLQVGWQTDATRPYWTAHLGAGAGWLQAATRGARYDALVGYVRPQLGFGLPHGFGATELGVYLMTPVPLVQVLHDRTDPAFAFPHFGVQLTFLLGDFRPPLPPPPPPPPQARRAPPPPPPANDEERPLAIPAHEWPPD